MSPEYFLYHPQRCVYLGSKGETAANGLALLFKSKFAAEQFAREKFAGQGYVAKPVDWK